MKTALRIVPVLIAAGLLAAAPAQATIVDFTSTTWSGVNNTNLFTDPGTGITISSSGGNMTFNSSALEIAGCTSAGAGLACAGDGIGINDDEVTGGSPELLVLQFPTVVDILDVHVLDLFANEAGGEGGTFDEKVELSTDGSIWFPFTSEDNPGGYLETGFMAEDVSMLYMRGFNNPVSDVALARIDFEPIPEPATLALLGIGLTGLGFRARRKRQ